LADGTPVVAHGETNGRLQLWNWRTGPVDALELGENPATAVCARGQGLAVGTANGDVLHWEPLRTRAVTRLYGHDGPVRSLFETPGEPTLVSAGVDGVLRRFDGRVTALVAGGRPTFWIGYREGAVVGDQRAAWGSPAGLDRLLLAGERWTAADV